MTAIKNLVAEKGSIYFAAQIICVIAAFLLLFSFQLKKHRNIMLMQAVAGLLFGIHYIMIEAYVGAVCNFLGMLRTAVYSFRGRSKAVDSIACPIVFAAAFAISGIFTYVSPFSLLPLAAMVLSSFVLWNPKTQELRALTLPTSVMWLIYNAHSGALIATLTEVASEISIFVGLYRFRKKKTAGKQEE